MIDTAGQKKVYSVKQINSYVKLIFEGDPVLRSVRIKGEVSNCKYHHSGHIYFSLKDEAAVISCVMFASSAKGLKIKLEDGKQIVVDGSISVYEAAGKYQIYVRKVEEEGEGDLYKKYELLKQKLEAEGIFSYDHKKPLPEYATRIGVVTAETGAVINDIVNVSKRRNPYVQIFLFPATVQGEGAAETIVRGIKKLDSLGLDVIIAGRGGGSIEDLWAFNEEPVVRAFYECNTPIISAVGHETDTTLSDYAADMRAPTPSAAAELAVFDHALFEKNLNDYRYSIKYHADMKLKRYAEAVKRYCLMMENLSPEKMIMQKTQRLIDARAFLEDRINTSLALSQERSRESAKNLSDMMVSRLDRYRVKTGLLAERLNGLSPLKRLSEGYAYVSVEGKRLKSIKQLAKDREINIYLMDGNAKAKVIETEEVDHE